MHFSALDLFFFRVAITVELLHCVQSSFFVSYIRDVYDYPPPFCFREEKFALSFIQMSVYSGPI
jgi:hypothetical protein